MRTYEMAAFTSLEREVVLRIRGFADAHITDEQRRSGARLLSRTLEAVVSQKSGSHELIGASVVECEKLRAHLLPQSDPDWWAGHWSDPSSPKVREMSEGLAANICRQLEHLEDTVVILVNAYLATTPFPDFEEL
jgi:hypothetical protein